MATNRTQKKPIERVHCNSCHQETKHAVVGECISKGSEPYGDPQDGITISWETKHTMLECQGCESVVMRRISWFSEWDDEQETFFPPPISRVMPAWKDRLDSEERELMKEVYAALQAGSRTLATMGARALVDMIMNKEVGDVGGFAAKMTAMKNQGIISQRNADILEAALDAGHAAAHRGHRPDSEQVDQVMDIVENLLHTHVLKDAASLLKASTPKRQLKKKTA